MKCNILNACILLARTECNNKQNNVKTLAKDTYKVIFVENIFNTLNFSLSKGRAVHVTATFNINEMKFSVFGLKDTTTKSSKMFFAMRELRYIYATVEDI